jgi:hypothetical protein
MTFTYPVTLSVLPSLRRGGVKVRIRHKRYLYCVSGGETITGPVSYGRRWSDDNYQEPYPLGGETTVDLTFPDGGAYVGVAHCSLRDRFCRRTGIAVALARALESRQIHVKYIKRGSIVAAERLNPGQMVSIDAYGIARPIPYNPTPSNTIHPR